jgi:hypothetical protein
MKINHPTDPLWLTSGLPGVRGPHVGKDWSGRCEILNISQSYRSPRPVTSIALLCFYCTGNVLPFHHTPQLLSSCIMKLKLLRVSTGRKHVTAVDVSSAPRQFLDVRCWREVCTDKDITDLFCRFLVPDVGSQIWHFARNKRYVLSPTCPATFAVWVPMIPCPYLTLEPRNCDNQPERRFTAAVVLPAVSCSHITSYRYHFPCIQWDCAVTGDKVDKLASPWCCWFHGLSWVAVSCPIDGVVGIFVSLGSYSWKHEYKVENQLQNILYELFPHGILCVSFSFCSS